ncbi:exported hypothetical protein [Candidatus Accumulibacter aalborgensis]|uniref:Uncharacterized protein n=1 Tax=Candidatus Accumulibacter aalborgensis TaxID=1860102 RepID=A0A1A8XUF8_9PROT|nr:tetratricopeptide repeat protein [Candidatus Accumulibacter aalborgensis]SBT08366.1 exported hypothetical protein [Candidatus Accumulibacter aalborgensis]
MLTFFRHFPGRALLCVIALWASSAGPASAAEPSADAPCPPSFRPQPPTDAALREAEVARLATLTEACHDRADYFAYQGMLLLTLGRLQEAALALEKAVLLDPDLAGAQLDYAQALAQLGELDSARSLAGEVAKRPDIPIALQAWLYDSLGAWQEDGWRLEWSIALLGGGESNLNSAPGIQFLTLTLPGGSVPVELAASEQRRSGGALRTALIGAAARSLGSGLVVISGEMTNRSSPSEADTNQRIVNGNAAYVHPALGGQMGVRVDQTRLWLGGEVTYHSSGWSLLFELPRQLSPVGCAITLGYGAENREFPRSTLQDGRYSGPQAWLACRHEDWQLYLGAQNGEDRASDAARLGGDQRRTDLTLGVGHRLGQDTVFVSAQRGRAVDQLPYSALLGGQARQIDRLSGRVAYEFPYTNQLSIVGYLESTSQKSNIDLFNMDNKAIYFGVRFRGR